MNIRAKNQCPTCLIDGYFLPLNKVDSNRLVYSGKATQWRCPECGLEWDINEDFSCIVCGKPVSGRFLYCSEKCTQQFDL